MVNFINKLMRGVEGIMIALLSTSVLIVVAQIIWRYVLRSPLGWTEQVARSEFIWIVMLGIPVIFNRNITMAFDILSSKLKGKAGIYLQIAIAVLGILFCIFYFIASMELCITTGGRRVSGIKIPYNMLYSAQPVAAALLLLVFVKQIIELLKGLRKGDEE